MRQSSKMIRCTQEMFKCAIKKLWDDHVPGDISFCVNDEWHLIDDPDPSHFSTTSSFPELEGSYSEVKLPDDYYHPRVFCITYFWKRSPGWKEMDGEIFSKFDIITEKDINPYADGLVSPDGFMSGDVSIGFIRNNSEYIHYTNFTKPDSLEIIVREQIRVFSYTRTVYWRMYRKDFELIPKEMRTDA